MTPFRPFRLPDVEKQILDPAVFLCSIEKKKKNQVRYLTGPKASGQVAVDSNLYRMPAMGVGIGMGILRGIAIGGTRGKYYLCSIAAFRLSIIAGCAAIRPLASISHSARQGIGQLVNRLPMESLHAVGHEKSRLGQFATKTAERQG